VLTADHGVAPSSNMPAIPASAKRSPPASRRSEASSKPRCVDGPHLPRHCGISDASTFALKAIVQKVEDYQVYLQQDHRLMIQADNFEMHKSSSATGCALSPTFVAAFTREICSSPASGKLFQGKVQRDVYYQRSGDVLFVLAPTLPAPKARPRQPWN